MPSVSQNSADPSDETTKTAEPRLTPRKLARFPITATAWSVLVVALAATAISWYLSHEQVEAHGQERFDVLTERTQDAIRKQMFEYEQVLRSGVALFSADPELKRQQWHNFADSRQLERFFPAIQSLGFVAWLRGEEKSALEMKMRADGVTEFSVHPEGTREKHAPLILLEPTNTKHHHELGTDLLTSPVLRATLELARDTGEAALSGKLPNDTSSANANSETLVALVLPVYRASTKPATPTERQDSIIGFIYASLRVADLLRDIIARDAEAQIDLEIFASRSDDHATLLFDKDAQLFGGSQVISPKYTTMKTLAVAGQPWQLWFASTVAFETAIASPKPWLLAMGGTLIDAFLFAVVVTLSSQRQRAVTREQTFQRSVLENLSDGIAVCDTKGQLIFCNRAFRALHDLPSDTQGLEQGTKLTAQEHAPLSMTIAPLRRALADETVVDVEMVLGSDPKHDVVVNSQAIYTTNGEKLGAVVVVHDTTAQKRAAAEMLQAKELAEGANRAKSEFLANISHELRTPLTAILGFAQLLKHDPTLANQHLAFANKIHKAGEHLLSLVNDLLDLARIEAGQLTVSLEPVSLISVLAECRALMQPLAEQKGIALSITDDAMVGTTAVIADRVRLRQILINLVSNAIKYNREGGSVSLTCACHNDDITLHVADTGAGLSKEQLTHIFQPFNRLGQELSQIEGTGIGLVITKRLVEKMRGKIVVESVKGQGSRFSVTLPAVASLPDVTRSQVQVERLPVIRTKAASCCVLCIEDNPANLELIGSLLTLNWPQLTYLAAANAEDGLQLATAHQPHLILLDINLPDMDGFAVMERLKRSEATAQIPVVAATANASDADIQRGKEIGFAAYLIKPFDLNKLLATVDQLLSEQLRSRTQDSSTVNVPANQVATTLPTNNAHKSDAPIEFPSVLDNAMTDQLEAALGSRAVPFIDQLLDDVPKRLAALNDAELHHDMQRLRAELHTLKGNSSNAGATSIAELCGRVSQACQDQRIGEIRDLLGTLRSEYDHRVQPALLLFRTHLAAQDKHKQ